jgi:hypothetical protein
MNYWLEIENNDDVNECATYVKDEQVQALPWVLLQKLQPLFPSANSALEESQISSLSASFFKSRKDSNGAVGKVAYLASLADNGHDLLQSDHASRVGFFSVLLRSLHQEGSDTSVDDAIARLHNPALLEKYQLEPGLKNQIRTYRAKGTSWPSQNSLKLLLIKDRDIDVDDLADLLMKLISPCHRMSNHPEQLRDGYPP